MAFRQQRPYVEEPPRPQQQRPYVEEEYYSQQTYAEERPHHHHHHQRPYVEEEYHSEGLYAAPPDCGYENSSFYAQSAGGRPHKSTSDYQHSQRLGELGAVAAGAFALYEGNKERKDPCNATKHKHEAEAAALGAMGSAGYGYYEHRQKDKFEDGRW